jgi:hypothetical protein
MTLYTTASYHCIYCMHAWWQDRRLVTATWTKFVLVLGRLSAGKPTTDSGTAFLFMSAFVSLCERQPACLCAAGLALALRLLI